jgi:predicted phage terminase large subunit-like protein
MATTRDKPPVIPSTGDEPEPYDEQIKFLGKDRPYYGFISGSGAGKTFAGVYRLWLNAEWWNKGHMGAIIVPDKSQFIDNVKPIMEKFGLMDRWEYNSMHTSEPGLVTENRDRILILSADNQRQIGRIKGKNLAYVWMDEEAEIPPRARQIADQRLRVGNYPNLFITTTPDGKNHTYDFFKGDIEDVQEDTYGRGKLFYNYEKLAIVGVPSEANPVLDDKDIERMRRNLPDAVVAQEIEGEFVEIGSGVLSKDMLNYIPPNDVPERSMDMYIGVDIGVQADANKAREQDSDYWAAAVLAVDPVHGDGYLVDLRRQRGMTLREGLQWLDGIHREADRATVLVESNQSQRWFSQQASDMGLPTQEVYNQENKEDRLVQLSIPFGNKTIQLLDWGDDRWQPFVNEWLAFPDGTHDDALDAVEIVVDNSPVDTGQTQILSGDMYGQNDEDR